LKRGTKELIAKKSNKNFRKLKKNFAKKPKKCHWEELNPRRSKQDPALLPLDYRLKTGTGIN
jgi:hypothetical protein